MDDVLLMHVVETKHDLANDLGCLALSEVLRGGLALKELTALRHLGNHVKVVLVFDQVHYVGDVGVGQLSQNGELTF